MNVHIFKHRNGCGCDGFIQIMVTNHWKYFLLAFYFFNNKLITLGKNSYHSLGTPLKFTIIFQGYLGKDKKNTTMVWSWPLLKVWLYFSFLFLSGVILILVMILVPTSFIKKNMYWKILLLFLSMIYRKSHKSTLPYKSGGSIQIPTNFYGVAIHHFLQKWWFHPNPH